MKSTFTPFLLAASIALAQNLSGQPPCATPCIITAISSAGCAPSDMGCQCGPTQAAIASIAAPCLLANCGLEDLLQAQSAGEAQCSLYSATRTASPPPPPAGTTGTAATVALMMKNDVVAAAVSGSGCGGHGGSSTSGGSGLTTTTTTTTSTATTTAGAPVSSPTASGTRTVVTAGAVASAIAQPVVVGAGALLGVLGVAAVL